MHLLLALFLSAAPVTATTGDLTLYVATTGADTNSCLSAARPCLTIQGAINKIPKVVRHVVTVNVAAGSYYTPESAPQSSIDSNAYINGFTVSGELIYTRPDDGSIPSITIQGTMAEVVASSAITVASSGHTASDVATVGAASWTVNAYTGMFIEKVPTDNTLFPIVSNTANTITFVNDSGALSGNIHIVAPSAHLVGGPQSSPSSGFLDGVMWISGAEGHSSIFFGIPFNIFNLDIQPYSGTGLRIDGSAAVNVFGVSCTAGAGFVSGICLEISNTRANVTSLSVNFGATPSTGLYLHDNAAVTTSRSMISAASGSGVLAIRHSIASMTATYSKAQRSFEADSGSGLSSTYSTAVGNGVAYIAGCSDNGSYVYFANQLTASNFNTGLKALLGGHCQYSVAASSFSSITNFAVLDNGSISSQATLQAATGKSLQNTLGSVITEAP